MLKIMYNGKEIKSTLELNPQEERELDGLVDSLHEGNDKVITGYGFTVEEIEETKMLNTYRIWVTGDRESPYDIKGKSLITVAQRFLGKSKYMEFHGTGELIAVTVKGDIRGRILTR